MGGFKITENKSKISDVAAATIGFAVFMIVLALLTIYAHIPTAATWLIMLAVIIVYFLGLGKLIKNNWAAILIDERNQMSLSRFQMVMWTLIVLSAFFAIGLSRIYSVSNMTLALDIGVPEQLWILLGISTVSLVGSPLILSRKKLKIPDGDRVKEEDLNKGQVGTVCTNESHHDASILDIFRGDEIVDCDYLNLAKLQMFFFTILIAVVYCVLLLDIMTKPGNPVIAGFPALSDGLIALLAISHGGYLTEKSVPSTPTTLVKPEDSPAEDQSKTADNTPKPAQSTDGARQAEPEISPVSAQTTGGIPDSTSTKGNSSQITESQESPDHP